METANNIIVATYVLYVLISVSLTIWVARTLYKRGAIFLIDAFHGNAELADSVNHLLVVGFYLINIGFVSLALKTAATINTSRAAIELLSDKMGMVLLILGLLAHPPKRTPRTRPGVAQPAGRARCSPEGSHPPMRNVRSAKGCH